MILPINLYFFAFLLLLVLYFAASKAEEEYTYTKGSRKGPENWWRLNPKWKVCGSGKLQSPINLMDNRVKELPQLGELNGDYKPAPAVLKNMDYYIMVQWKGDAGQLHINGTYYKLIQCHWHIPSEHTLNGLKFDLELHALHKNSKGYAAVIGILYTIGSSDPLLSKLFNAIKSIGDKDIDLGVINPGDIKFGSGKYYRYVGSLTSPPCTEGVVWKIMKKAGTVSRKQLSALKGVVHHHRHGFEESARPTQELNGRQVWLYNPMENGKPN
ncbi:hypothetical protein VNO78_17069 [Psophocarpus tetragonolobus]|uniref:Carbonic anhydrase n=1 Tax=Psophocarpus tetragonolobus TaxID=3891 RepID=A0AAN9SGL4_PSOTE